MTAESPRDKQMKTITQCRALPDGTLLELLEIIADFSEKEYSELLQYGKQLKLKSDFL